MEKVEHSYRYLREQVNTYDYLDALAWGLVFLHSGGVSAWEGRLKTMVA